MEVLKQADPIGRHLLLATLFLLVILLIGSVVSLTVLIRLSPDYFAAAHAQNYRNADHGILSRAGVILKNLLGAALIVLGVVLSLPGIPGQGLLTVLAGILLLDFPGKRKLLFKMLSRPSLLRSINRLRAKFSRPPLLVG
jgi:small-conductance mechanosensitive channel